jgi:hypothetical protein
MVETDIKRKRGAQPGNKNARKYDSTFYTPEDYELLGRGYTVVTEGLDKAIAIIRVKIKSLLRCQPHNYDLILEATNALVKLTRIKQKVHYAQKNIRFPRLV